MSRRPIARHQGLATLTTEHRVRGQIVATLGARDSKGSTATEAELTVSRILAVLSNTPGSLSALATVIARNQGNISNLKITDRDPEFFEMRVDIEVRDAKHLSNIVAALRLDPAIASVERVRG